MYFHRTYSVIYFIQTGTMLLDVLNKQGIYLRKWHMLRICFNDDRFDSRAPMLLVIILLCIKVEEQKTWMFDKASRSVR